MFRPNTYWNWYPDPPPPKRRMRGAFYFYVILKRLTLSFKPCICGALPPTFDISKKARGKMVAIKTEWKVQVRTENLPGLLHLLHLHEVLLLWHARTVRIALIHHSSWKHSGRLQFIGRHSTTKGVSKTTVPYTQKTISKYPYNSFPIEI